MLRDVIAIAVCILVYMICEGDFKAIAQRIKDHRTIKRLEKNPQVVVSDDDLLLVDRKDQQR